MPRAQIPDEDKWTLNFDPYKILDVSAKDATLADIERAFKAKIKYFHGDKVKGKEEHAKKLTAAYNHFKGRSDEKLKELAQIHLGEGSGSDNPYAYDGRDLSNVLVDKTKSEEFRRAFHEISNKNHSLRDNFQSCYKKGFDNVVLPPEVKPGYRCSLCEEDFIEKDHHDKLVDSAYREFISEGAEPGDIIEYLESEIGTRVHFHPFKISNEYFTGAKGKLATEFHYWCDRFFPFKLADTLAEKMRIVNTIVENYGESIRNILEILISNECDLEERIDLALEPWQGDTLTLDCLFAREIIIIPAYMHVVEQFTEWKNFAIKMVSMSPRLATLLVCVNKFINPDIEDNFYEVGKAIIKSEQYPHFADWCFRLGNCDLNFVAKEIVCWSEDSDMKCVAANYLRTTKDVQKLQALVAEALRKGDRTTAIIFAYAYACLAWLDIPDVPQTESGVSVFKSILPVPKYWNLVQRMVRIEPGRLRIVAADAVVMVILENMSKSSNDGKQLEALSGALHIVEEWDKLLYKQLLEKVLNGIRVHMDSKLVQGDAHFILGLARVPGILPVLKDVLENKQYLGDKPVTPQLGSPYHTCLLLLRGVYHYKLNKISAMEQDLANAALNTINSSILTAISTFVASNPMIHEKILKATVSQFRQLQAYIDDYTGDPLEESNFHQIFQKSSSNEESRLSALISFSRTGPNLNVLEKHILENANQEHRNKSCSKNASLSADDYAAIGYSYVDLETICYTFTTTINCWTQAATYFLKAARTASDTDFGKKMGYASLAQLCAQNLKTYADEYKVSVFLALHCQKAYLSFLFQSTQHLSETLRKTGKHNGTNPLCVEDSSDILVYITQQFQNIIKWRTLVPLSVPDIYTIGEGELVMHLRDQLYHNLLKEKIRTGLFSRNILPFLYHYKYFEALWEGHREPEDTGYDVELQRILLELARIPQQRRAWAMDKENDDPVVKRNKIRMLNSLELEETELQEQMRELKEAPMIQRVGFQSCRENLMISLTDLYGHNLRDVECMMNFHVIRRTPDGFIDMNDTTLNFDGEQAYSRFYGIKLDPEKNSCQFMLEPAVAGDPSKPALFTSVDLMESFGNKIIRALLSFDEFLAPPNMPDYLKVFLLHNPFFKVRYFGRTPDGDSRESICGTNLLMSLYHLDLLAKIFTTGQEVGANFPFPYRDTQSHMLKGLPKQLQKVLQPIGHRKKAKHLTSKVQRIGFFNRFWFDVEQVERKIRQGTEENGGVTTIEYDDVSLVLKTMPLMRGDNGELKDAAHLFDKNGPEAEFAKEFNDNLSEIEKTFLNIKRVKELAKISNCFFILHSKKDTFGKDFSALHELLNIQMPPTRPYSQCHRGHKCECCDLVPAVYHQMKVTLEQKTEYVLERRSMEPPKNALQQGENGRSTNSSTADANVRTDIVEDEPAAASTPKVNLESYNRVEVFRCYGGVSFQPTTKTVRWVQIPRSHQSIPWRSAMSISSLRDWLGKVKKQRQTVNGASGKFAISKMSSTGRNGGVGTRSDPPAGPPPAGPPAGPPSGPPGGPPKGPYIPTDNIKHIFKNEKGHLPDTKENHDIIVDVAKTGLVHPNPDMYGNIHVEKIMPCGGQGWVRIRNGVIDNGGVNAVGWHRIFHPKTGFFSPGKSILPDSPNPKFENTRKNKDILKNVVTKGQIACKQLDSRGNAWFSQVLNGGGQAWVYVHWETNTIIDCGINDSVQEFHPATGFLPRP